MIRLTVIGDEAFDVYNAFSWESDEEKVKIDEVPEYLEKLCEPPKNTIYGRYLFLSSSQEKGLWIDE